MLMVAGSQTAAASGVFGPISNAVLALGLFLVMLLVVRSRRPRLSRRSPIGPAAVGGPVRRDDAAASVAARVEPGPAPSAVGDDAHPVCGESPTGR